MHKDLKHDAERLLHHRTAQPAVGGVAARAAPYSPAGLLGLQRLAGNRAVTGMLAAPAVSIQRRRTVTGLKREHAEKVYYNHLKGDPPFKPLKGNFGALSWFAGSGNPYVGGQAKKYDVTVDVNINPDPGMLDRASVNRFINSYATDNNVDLRDQRNHHDFWVAFGRWLQGVGTAEVPIDVSDVNWKEAGTFIVVGATGREAISLANPGKLATDLGGSQAMTDKLKVRETKRASSFQFVFDKVPPDIAAAGKPQQFLLAVVPQPPNLAKDEKAFPAMGWGGKKTDPYVTVTFTLGYATYAAARVQAKRLATAISDGRFAGKPVGVRGGAGWPASAIRSYRA